MATNESKKEASTAKGCLGCLFLIAIIVATSYLLTSCGRSNIVEKTDTPNPVVISEPPKTTTINAPTKVEKIMPLDQYNQHLKALLDEVVEEYLLVKKIKGTEIDVLGEHHVKIQDKINDIRVTNRKYHIHTALDGRLIAAHEYIISLNQAYRSKNTKQIDDFINLIEENIANFKELSMKVDNKEIPNDYYNQETNY